MLWHIVQRELFQQLSSLRFVLATVLIVLLMIVNAIGHIHQYKTQQIEYRRQVSASLERLQRNSNNLYNLVVRGPGGLNKQPSKLSFCAQGSENHLPTSVFGWSAGWGKDLNIEGTLYKVSGLWRLQYGTSPPITGTDIFPTFLKIDWTLIISIVLSFVALVFTFDAVSGELERGTLRLTLSNSIARGTLLVGKFLSTLISLGVAFMSGILINLLLLHLSGTLQLNGEEWIRIGGIFAVSLIYLSLFSALGLLVSSLVERSATSLVMLLLIWIIWVVLIPATLGTILSGLNLPQANRDYSELRSAQLKEITERYEARGLYNRAPTRARPPTPATLLWAKFLNEEAQADRGLNKEFLTARIYQIQVARNFNRVSPAAIAQYVIESFAGTGFQRHLNFLKNAENYANEFNNFLISADRADADSPHVPFVREGMSDKPVPFESIPKFQDRVRLERIFEGTILDIGLLLLFFTLLFASAHVSFQSKEI